MNAEQKARERARELFPCSCGLDELFEHAGKNNRLGHAGTCPAHMRQPVTAALLDFRKEGLEEIKDIPQMLEVAADFILQHGDLDKNATGLSAILLRNKAQAIRRLGE